MSFKVKVITNIKQWSNWQEEWNDLLDDSLTFEARIFLSYEWLTTWWQFFSSRKKLMVIAFGNDKNLVAAAPFFSAPSPIFPFARVLKFVGDGNSDYSDFLVRKGFQDSAKLIWQWLFANCSLWDIIALHELPSNSQTISALKRIQIPDGIRVSVLAGEICHRISFDNHFASWREQVSQSLREQLKRRERQILRNFSVQFSLAQSSEEVEKVMSQLFALHRLRWGQLGQTGVFIFPKVRQFHIEFAKKALSRGWLKLHRLDLDGSIAAAYYAFKLGDYSGFYSCGFNPKFTRYSVGKVLLAKVIDDAQKEGAKVFDFMRGDENYKSEFGTVTQRNFHLFVWQQEKPISRSAAISHKFTTWLALKLKEKAQR
ncbi:MAG: GNAT family N-acetyltransferase [Armatimonadetes bacterium]|nr:GNAT family N-acetyltransferase [Armatimonadota bacterium]MDW8027013.1 GNAT family N-acetyltransferase [Armatimonadota bacterium]